MCGPNDDRLAEDRRLEDVVAAVIDEAAADEHGRRELIELRQLADRVEHDDVGARLGVDRQLRSPRRSRNPASRARRSTSPNRSGWRGARIEQRAGRRRLDARERAQHGRLLAVHRAAGDDHRPVRRDAEEPQHALARLAVRDAARQLERIELQAAGDRHARRIGAEIDRAGAPTPRSACRSGRRRRARGGRTAGSAGTADTIATKSGR